MAPIDKDLIIQERMNNNEKNWLNKYHKTVFKNLSQFMNKTETLELKKLVQLFKILFQSFSKIILIFNCLACSTFLFCWFRVSYY